jgi:RNA polymerase sigma factor (TIGR02999 family)
LGRAILIAMSEVTRILSAIDQGDPQAAGQLLPLVYDELRKLAAAKMAAERPDHTLDATALVHEVYLRLVGEMHFDRRGHFFAAAAEAMRRILVEHARRHARGKRGGGRQRVPLDESQKVVGSHEDLIAVDEAISQLAAEDPKKAELVKLRFFAGLTMPEAAAALDISLATAERWWMYARTWLFAALDEENPTGP